MSGAAFRSTDGKAWERVYEPEDSQWHLLQQLSMESPSYI
ncbi:MAG: hypothetical protein ACI92E_003162 [Oceanicoccus sp.]|jgi:hypothetical protein